MTDAEQMPKPGAIDAADTDPLDSQWLHYLASVVMTAVATVVAIGVDAKVNIPNLSLVFVIPVVVAGVSLGLGPSLCAAILGALAFNFFLTEPRYSLVIDDPSNIWAMGLLFVVGLIVSGVAFTSQRRAGEASLLRRQATVLQAFSRDVVAAENADAISSIASRALSAMFRVPAVVILFEDGRAVGVKRSGDMEVSEEELEAARSCVAARTVLHGGVYPHLASRFDFWPVRTVEGRNAAIGLAFDRDERPSAPDTQVTVVASLLALSLDRQPPRGASS